MQFSTECRVLISNPPPPPKALSKRPLSSSRCSGYVSLARRTTTPEIPLIPPHSTCSRGQHGSEYCRDAVENADSSACVLGKHASVMPCAVPTLNHQAVVEPLSEATGWVLHLHGVHSCMLPPHLVDGEAMARHFVTCGILQDAYAVLIPAQNLTEYLESALNIESSLTW